MNSIDAPADHLETSVKLLERLTENKLEIDKPVKWEFSPEEAVSVLFALNSYPEAWRLSEGLSKHVALMQSTRKILRAMIIGNVWGTLFLSAFWAAVFAYTGNPNDGLMTFFHCCLFGFNESQRRYIQ